MKSLPHPPQRIINKPLRIYSVLSALCLSMAGIYPSHSSILLDNFDSYSIGQLANGMQWPTAIPETGSPGQFWISGDAGSKAIVDATDAGLNRNGNVYRTTVNTGNANSHSRTRLAAPHTGEIWEVSFDFYIDALTAEGPNFLYNLMGIYDTGGADNTYSADNLVARIYAQENNGSYTLSASFGNTVGGENTGSFGAINAGEWYTVSILGNNLVQTLSFTLSGSGTEKTIANKFYVKDTHRIDGFLMGSQSSRVTGTVYVDNFSVIPEPGTSLLLSLGAAGFLTVALRKSKGDHKI